MKIAIQGGYASFHDEAAEKYFGGDFNTLVPCKTFKNQCNVLKSGSADLAIMAVENTLAGSILPNYTLIDEYSLHIQGEVYIHIQQNLLALPGIKLSEIEYIKSHPMALNQCSNFLESLNGQIKTLEGYDTADSAKEIKELNINKTAAIAGKKAAKLYGLQILAPSIENIKKNYTRFLVLSTEKTQPAKDADKASVSFRLKHEAGALYNVLGIFNNHNINLSLLQSVPIPGKPNEYAFQADFLFGNFGVLETLLNEISGKTVNLKLLGVYKSGKIDYENSPG